MSWANLAKKEGTFTITESSCETFGLHLWTNFGTKEPVGLNATGGNWWDLPKEFQEPAFLSVKAYVLRKQDHLDSPEIDIALYVFSLSLLSSLTKTKFPTKNLWHHAGIRNIFFLLDEWIMNVQMCGLDLLCVCDSSQLLPKLKNFIDLVWFGFSSQRSSDPLTTFQISHLPPVSPPWSFAEIQFEEEPSTWLHPRPALAS